MKRAKSFCLEIYNESKEVFFKIQFYARENTSGLWSYQAREASASPPNGAIQGHSNDINRRLILYLATDDFKKWSEDTGIRKNYLS